MDGVTAIPLTIVICGGAVAAVSDIWKYRVPNFVTVSLLLTGLLYHFWVGGFSGLGFSLVGATFGFALLFLLYVLGGVGAGDVKLLAGLGAWLGLMMTLQVFVVAALATGLYAVVLLAIRGGVGNVTAHFLGTMYHVRNFAFHLTGEERVEEVVKQDDRRRRLIPFAAMLVLGVSTVVLVSHLLGADVVTLLRGG